MLRAIGAVPLSIVDVREAGKYALGHVLFALSVRAETLRSHLGCPEALAALLGPAAVNPQHQVVLMAESGLTPGAALAFLVLEQLGQKKVSVLMDSVVEWGLRGHGLSKEPTVVGVRKIATDITVPVARYGAQPRTGVVIGDPSATQGQHPKVHVAAGKALPGRCRKARWCGCPPPTFSSPTIPPRPPSTTAFSG